MRSTFPTLKKLCEQRPGVVLGDLDTGHWVTYHAKCGVIADVFLLTPQHAARRSKTGGSFSSRRRITHGAAGSAIRLRAPGSSFMRDEKGAETPT